MERFASAGGDQKPRYGRYTVCWAESEEEARKTAYKWWRSTAIKGDAKSELPLPQHFEQLASMATEDDVAESVICGPDPGPHIERIKKFVQAGYTHVSVHHVSPDQEGFLRFYESTVMPELTKAGLINGRAS